MPLDTTPTPLANLVMLRCADGEVMYVRSDAIVTVKSTVLEAATPGDADSDGCVVNYRDAGGENVYEDCEDTADDVVARIVTIERGIAR